MAVSTYMASEHGNRKDQKDWFMAGYDERLVGNPGDINRTTDKNGYERETKIGPDGKARGKRHHSDHGNPSKHSDPHDHKITWGYNRPNFGLQQNYWDGNAPTFKKPLGDLEMANIVYKHSHNTPEEDRFKTISDFKWCMKCGGEVNFTRKGIEYWIIRYGKDKKITIYEPYKPETEVAFNTSDDALEHIVSGDRLRDVITQVNVIDRTI